MDQVEVDLPEVEIHDVFPLTGLAACTSALRISAPPLNATMRGVPGRRNMDAGEIGMARAVNGCGGGGAARVKRPTVAGAVRVLQALAALAVLALVMHDWKPEKRPFESEIRHLPFEFAECATFAKGVLQLGPHAQTHCQKG